MKKSLFLIALILIIININAFSVYIVKSGIDSNEDKLIDLIKNKARYDYIIFNISEPNLELSNIVGNILLNKPNAVLLIGDRAINEIGVYIKDIPVVVTMFNSMPDTLKKCKLLCGINYDFVNKELVKYIKNKFPELKKIGIIFKVENSMNYAKYIKEIFENDTISVEFANVNNADDFQLAIKILKASEVDMLWLGNDSIVLEKNNFKKLGDLLIKEKIPILSTNGLYLKDGVFASIMYSIEDIALNTANILIRLNNGELPKEIGMISPEQFKIALNKNLIKKFNIKINTGKK